MKNTLAAPIIDMCSDVEVSEIRSGAKATANRMEIFKEYPDVVGIAEICKMLGVGRKTATHLLKDRKIPYIQIGREYKVAKPDVINFVLNLPMDDDYFAKVSKYQKEK